MQETQEHVESCMLSQLSPPLSLYADIGAWVPARETFIYIPRECAHLKTGSVFKQHRLFNAEVHITIRVQVCTQANIPESKWGGEEEP